MCGFAGLVDLSGQMAGDELRALAVNMADILSHRGPDDSGIWISKDNHVGLCHRRLSIIDLSPNGHQPMSNEDGSIWITYNGEVYNFKEIRAILETRGHVFKSSSDTEVVIHAYEEWGEGCLSRFSGMFAFAIWDEKRKKLFLARDRLGQKPLFYYWDKKRLVFASEMQAIMEDKSVLREVDYEAIHYYLSYQYIPAPKTAFKSIYKLPPAHYLILGNGNIDIKRYWRIGYSEKLSVKDEEEIIEELIDILKETVKSRLISEVPLGAFLSGGVDSSIVVALMSDLMDKPAKTFSIGFEEELYNELPYARIIAEKFNTDHHEFILKYDTLDILPKLVKHYGEPYADSSALPTYYLSRMTRKYVTVALSGDAGDENFAGYDRYLAQKILRYFKAIPSSFRKSLLVFLDFFPESDGNVSRVKRLKRFIRGSLWSDGQEYIKWMVCFTEEQKKEFYSSNMLSQMRNINSYDYLMTLFKKTSASSMVEKTMEVDINSYLPYDLLVKVDIASMANSLEVRSPFLDHKFIEFVARIPVDYKLKGMIKKYILKKAFKKIIPEEVLRRPKKGFGVPVCRWFRHDLKDYLSDTLLSRRSIERGYFKSDGIRRLLAEHISGRIDHSQRLWTLLMLELWHREFID